MKPWKSQMWLRTVSEQKLLQWGHGDEAVEEHTNRLCLAAIFIASMGPRR